MHRGSKLWKPKIINQPNVSIKKVIFLGELRNSYMTQISAMRITPV